MGARTRQLLSRKCRASAVIGGVEGVERLPKVTVLRIDHEAVRPGIGVGPDVVVDRQEA